MRKRKLRVLVLMHEDLVPPESLEGSTDEQIDTWKTEYDIIAALKTLGHEVRPLGVLTDLAMIDTAVKEFKPHIAFNILEEFHGVAVYDHYVVSHLELLRQPYTGCNPRGLMLSHDKGLSKKVLAYHRIPVPRFAVFPLNRRGRRPEKLGYPLLVKSLTEEGSVGIAQASVVHNNDQLADRVDYIHRQIGTDAIAEEYIDGRELYVGILGNERLQTLPIWEMKFANLPADAPRIATSKIKWDRKYQQKVGVTTTEATDLSPKDAERVRQVCKRAYRILNLSGYARMDLRMTEAGKLYVIEANPNPQLAYGEDFAESAHHVGIKYEPLIQRIVDLGLLYRPQWQV